MIRRYFVFGGSNLNHPVGGWGDFLSSFERPVEATDFLENYTDENLDWYQIVDSLTGIIVFEK